MDDVAVLESWGCHVYFIQGGDYVKVGRAVDVPARMRELQVGCPHKLRLIGTVEGGHKEKWAHERLANYRVRGEWFTWNSDVERIVRTWIRRGSDLRKPGAPRRPYTRRATQDQVRAFIDRMPPIFAGILRAQDS